MNILKTLFQSMALSTLIWTTASAQPSGDFSTQVIDENLNTYAKQQDGGWFAYSIPAAPNTHSMCCYNQGKQSVCDLNKSQQGYGSSSDSPYTENIHVLVHMDQGQVNQIMPVGDACEVKAEGITVGWLTHVSEQQSIQWLKSQAMDNITGHHNGSLYVLSLHQGKAAATALYELAKQNPGQPGGQENSEQAVFWLGQRQQDGFEYLKSLYQDLPVGDVRRKLNFALSQNNTLEAVDLLKSIALEDQDDEQQSDAIFWLSQTDEVAGLPAFLIGLVSDSNKQAVKEQAIFSLSQINNDEANDELMALVKDHKDAEVREKALFWLAQNSPEQAKQAALEVLNSNPKQSGSEKEWDNAVFVLSQLPREISSAVLFSIVKGDYARNIKKKALFWLSQSVDEATISQLEKML